MTPMQIENFLHAFLTDFDFKSYNGSDGRVPTDPWIWKTRVIFRIMTPLKRVHILISITLILLTPKRFKSSHVY